MAKEDKIRRLKAENNDLRDAIDKLESVADGDIKKAVNRAIERANTVIDKNKILIKKLRKEIKNRENDSKPHVVLTRISPNISARTTDIQAIVIHCTQSNNIEASSADIAGVANWFANPSSQVSAHVITDADGFSGVCAVPRQKAWHCAAFNSPTIGIENIGWAHQTSWSEKQYDECARWVAEFCKEFNIPCQRGSVSGSTITKKGILTHGQLGPAGGSHTDPGNGFDVDKVIEKAKKYL